MACYCPLVGFRSRVRNSNGNYIYFFNSKNEEAYADMPRLLPCGRCIGCKLERSRQWAARCVHEDKMSETSCFITLTYDNKNLLSPSLVYPDFQDFIKRLRENLNGRRISYYMCGEYGSKTARPHFHALVYDWRPHDLRPHQMLDSGHMIYTSGFLESVWGKGFCPVGDVTFESAAYVARYITTKITGDDADAHYSGRVPEFNQMSLKPAIGFRFFEKYCHDFFAKDELIINGHPSNIPRYYNKMYEKFHPKAYAFIRKKRRFDQIEKDLKVSRFIRENPQFEYQNWPQKLVYSPSLKQSVFRPVPPPEMPDWALGTCSTRLLTKEAVKLSQFQKLVRAFE